MLRRQNICSSGRVHVKDWLSFPSNRTKCIWKRSKESKIPKYLEFTIDESPTWSKHVKEITKTITAGIRALKRLRDFASRDVLVQFIMH